MQQRNAPRRSGQRGRPVKMPPEKAARPQMVGRRRDARKPVRRKRIAHNEDYINLFGFGPIQKREAARIFIICFAVVVLGFALLWGGTWVYGHFRWGWTL